MHRGVRWIVELAEALPWDVRVSMCAAQPARHLAWWRRLRRRRLECKGRRDIVVKDAHLHQLASGHAARRREHTYCLTPVVTRRRTTSIGGLTAREPRCGGQVDGALPIEL